MSEIFMNGFWTLLGATIVAVSYYYGYCRGDRKRYDLMKDNIKRATEEHWKTNEEAFRAGYKEGRAKKMGVDKAYKVWAMTPLKEAVEGALNGPRAPIHELVPEWPDHDCGDCIHGDYDVEDTDPKTYVFICKKGLNSSAPSCKDFEKKIWDTSKNSFIQKEKE